MNKIIGICLLVFVIFGCTKDNENKQISANNEGSFLQIRGDFD